MDLSPDDIVSYRFKQSLRGYAVDEVDALLDRLADQVENQLAELEQLRDRVAVAEEIADRTRRNEATIQRTLVTAQEAAERSTADAATQAERTLAEANEDADRIRREAEEDAAQRRDGADDEAARIVGEAQQLARREAEAARARVDEAARRHADVIARIAEHRDALRQHLATLEELTESSPPEPRPDLVAGELPTEGTGGGADDPGGPLRVRVSDHRRGPSPASPPLGSRPRDGG